MRTIRVFVFITSFFVNFLNYDRMLIGELLIERKENMSKDILEATKELEEWLSHPNELGHKPSKIEYTNQFVDEDGIECLIFKYKKSLLSKWLLGIVSESGTFSEMQEYNKDTEVQDATLILNMLKQYWKDMAKRIESANES